MGFGIYWCIGWEDTSSVIDKIPLVDEKLRHIEVSCFYARVRRSLL